MAKVVAVDAGTTGVRALAVDEQARVTDVAYRELTQHFPRPGWVEHDPAEIWDAVRASLAELGARLADGGDTVAAIGITNQRETLVAFDRSTGRPLYNAIVWQDRRTAALCAEDRHPAARGDDALGDLVTGRPGNIAVEHRDVIGVDAQQSQSTATVTGDVGGDRFQT